MITTQTANEILALAVPAAGAVVGVSCAECGAPIAEGQPVLDLFHYKPDGALDYIELFHAACGVRHAASVAGSAALFVNRRATVRHGGPYDRGSADAYYGRPFDPHYYEGNTGQSRRIEADAMTADERAAYAKGYHEETDRKGWGE